MHLKFPYFILSRFSGYMNPTYYMWRLKVANKHCSLIQLNWVPPRQKKKETYKNIVLLVALMWLHIQLNLRKCVLLSGIYIKTPSMWRNVCQTAEYGEGRSHVLYDQKRRTSERLKKTSAVLILVLLFFLNWTSHIVYVVSNDIFEKTAVKVVSEIKDISMVSSSVKRVGKFCVFVERFLPDKKTKH